MESLKKLMKTKSHPKVNGLSMDELAEELKKIG